MAKPYITVDNAINLYIKYLRAYSKAPNTVQNYSICLKHFFKYFGAFQTKNINDKHLSRFIELLSSNSDNPDIKLLRYLKTLRYFISWCEQNKVVFGISSNTIASKDRKLEQKLYPESRIYEGEYVSLSEMAKLNLYWQKKEELDTLYALRNRAIMATIGNTGLKVSEVMNLKRNDLNRDELKIKDRSIAIPISADAAGFVQGYLRKRPDFADDMFVAYSAFNKDKITAHPLTVRSIQRLVKSTAEEVGIEKKVTPQILRNSSLIRALAIKEDLGTTRKDIFEHFGFVESNSSYQRFLPAAQSLLIKDAL